MTRKRYIAIHTFHSDKSKEAFYAFNAENPQTDQEMLEAWTFEKCQLAATWFSDDDFFFCHWLAESDQDIHQALKLTGYFLNRHAFGTYPGHNPDARTRFMERLRRKVDSSTSPNPKNQAMVFSTLQSKFSPNITASEISSRITILSAAIRP